jgi:cell division GTPase FtsZ
MGGDRLASNYIKERVADDAEIVWGIVFDEDMGDECRSRYCHRN